MTQKAAKTQRSVANLITTLKNRPPLLLPNENVKSAHQVIEAAEYEEE